MGFVSDCIRFAKFRNDSSDPSDSSDSIMKKTPRVRHAFHSRKSEEYTLDLDRSYSRCFFRSRVTPRVTRITRVVVNLCESNTISEISCTEMKSLVGMTIEKLSRLCSISSVLLFFRNKLYPNKSVCDAPRILLF